MWKKGWPWLVAAALVAAVLAVACAGGDDSGVETDDDSGDDDSGGGGVCFWCCEWFDQVSMEGPFCVSPVDTSSACEEQAQSNCVDSHGGELTNVAFDTDCSDCNDESC